VMLQIVVEVVGTVCDVLCLHCTALAVYDKRVSGGQSDVANNARYHERTILVTFMPSVL